MNENLKQVIEQKLSDGNVRSKPWARLVVAACDGDEALDAVIGGVTPADGKSGPQSAKSISGAFLKSISVEGFRGIGAKQTLSINPGPGLTIVAGRNGSGKSSFAEALEVLLTGDSKRWSDRSKIWKEGWRNLHHPDPSRIDAELVTEGGPHLNVTCGWAKEADLSDCSVAVQPKGKPKTTLEDVGWSQALVSYRPFLSYNELGSMLDEGPSKLYDALSLVLGLEDLVNAQSALSQSRLDRQRSFDTADEVRAELIEQLKTLLTESPDDRATACLDAITSKDWGLTELGSIVGVETTPQPSHEIAVLTRALALDIADRAAVVDAASALRIAQKKLDESAGGDADKSRQVASLLEAAMKLHVAHGDRDCPLCGGSPGLNAQWAEATKKQIARLRTTAAASEDAHRTAEMARRTASDLLTAPPKLLTQLFDIGVEGLAATRDAWQKWHAGATIVNLGELADHLETAHEALADALETLKGAVAEELKRREDRWRPLATAIASWLDLARKARERAEVIPQIKDAEKWLKDASADIRNQRFAPIADKAMATWEHLRQQSNVTLGKIELTGSKGSRRVSLDVTVDGVAGAALGVMSQGELHSLALSLFLPRATLSESPFRFVVIDDPVQSMDPSRVDGLARALEETAKTRQVVVFTHDERLSDAVRRLGIASRILSVTRRAKSVVEIRTSLDPVKANIEDALALVHTTDLPAPVLRRIVPGFCRAALEASLIESVRRRLLTKGQPHDQIDAVLAKGGKLTPLAALALFEDPAKGSEVLARLNKFGPWAADTFKQCNEGAHKEYAGDLMELIRDTEKLTERMAAL
jgi:ABC-type Mn2+/Zn2+ transport system ATPase subunit